MKNVFFSRHLASIVAASLAIAVSVVATTCTKYIHCPVFPEHLTAYFPYSMGYVLKFANGKGDTLNFEVISRRIDDNPIVKVPANCGCGECDNPYFAVNAYIYGHGNSIGGGFEINRDDSTTTLKSGVVISNKWGHFEKISPNNPYLGNMFIFEDTLCLADDSEIDTSYMDGVIDSMCIVKDKGIVMFHEKETDIFWRKIE